MSHRAREVPWSRRYAVLREGRVRQPESKVPHWTAEDERNLAERVRRVAERGLAKSVAASTIEKSGSLPRAAR